MKDEKLRVELQDLVEEHDWLLNGIADILSHRYQGDGELSLDHKRIIQEQLDAMILYSDLLLIRIQEGIF